MKTVCGSCGNVEVVEVDEKTMHPLKGAGLSLAATFEPDMAGMIAKRKKAKKKRLVTLGAWAATIPEGKTFEDNDEDPDFYLCGTDRKVHPGSDGPCVLCAGGCHAEKGLPTLLEIEGLAEMDFGMKVLDSGYGAQADMFIVHVERKDGKVVEIMYDGSTAETQGWHLLDDQVLSSKSFEEATVITTEEASAIALKEFEGGDVLAVQADTFEGQDAWVVEMTKSDGDEIDVYVGLDGTTLGYDVYEKADSEVDGETKSDDESTETTDEEADDDEEVVEEVVVEAVVEAAAGEVVEAPVEEAVEAAVEVVDGVVEVQEKSLEDIALLADLAEMAAITQSI